MSNVDDHCLPADVDFTPEARAKHRLWDAAQDRWSVGLTLAVVGTVSLAIWSGLLFILLT